MAAMREVDLKRPAVPPLDGKAMARVCHKREGAISGPGSGERCTNVFELFSRMYRDGENEIMQKSGRGREDAINTLAELFVAEAAAYPGWHGQVQRLTESLSNNSNEAMRLIAAAISHHAEQIWAARHMP